MKKPPPEPLITAAWVGGPTSRGFQSILARYAEEGIRLQQVFDAASINRHVDCVLISAEYDGHSRAAATAVGDRLGVPVASVPVRWSAAAEVLRRHGVFDLVERARRLAADAALAATVATPPTKDLDMPITPVPAKTSPTTPQTPIDRISALLDGLDDPAMIDAVLSRTEKLKRRRVAVGIAASLDELDDDTLLEVAIALQPKTRVALRGCPLSNARQRRQWRRHEYPDTRLPVPRVPRVALLGLHRVRTNWLYENGVLVGAQWRRKSDHAFVIHGNHRADFVCYIGFDEVITLHGADHDVADDVRKTRMR